MREEEIQQAVKTTKWSLRMFTETGLLQSWNYNFRSSRRENGKLLTLAVSEDNLGLHFIATRVNTDDYRHSLLRRVMQIVRPPKYTFSFEESPIEEGVRRSVAVRRGHTQVFALTTFAPENKDEQTELYQNSMHRWDRHAVREMATSITEMTHETLKDEGPWNDEPTVQ